MAAVINDYKVGDFREQKFILSQLWKLDVHVKESAEP